MTPKRGDVVTVAAAGDFGKPRPAVIIQSDVFPQTHRSVIVWQMTSTIEDAPDFRITIAPSKTNGLRTRSQIMADKPVTVRRERIGDRLGELRERIGDRLGELEQGEIKQLNRALALALGLAD